MSRDVKVEIDWQGIAALLTGNDLRQLLEQIGFAIVARVVPKTGNDTGALRQATTTWIEEEDGSLVLLGGADLDYAIYHWAPGKPGGRRAGWEGTRAWTRTLDEMGIPYQLEEGYPV